MQPNEFSNFNSLNRTLQMVLNLKSESNSSSESLLTLLNASIENQQSFLNSSQELPKINSAHSETIMEEELYINPEGEYRIHAEITPRKKHKIEEQNSDVLEEHVKSKKRQKLSDSAEISKKKKKHRDSGMENVKGTTRESTIESDNEREKPKKKKKHRDSNIEDAIEKDSEHGKPHKKKKHRDSEGAKEKTVESATECDKPRKKKKDRDRESGKEKTIESASECDKPRKKKKQRDSESAKEETVESTSECNQPRKKKKDRDSESGKEKTIESASECDKPRKKKKHRESNLEDITVTHELTTEPKKKKKHRDLSIENAKEKTVESDNDRDRRKKKKKHRESTIEHVTEEIYGSNTESISEHHESEKKKKQHKYFESLEMHEVVNKKTKTKKHNKENENEERNNLKSTDDETLRKKSKKKHASTVDESEENQAQNSNGTERKKKQSIIPQLKEIEQTKNLNNYIEAATIAAIKSLSNKTRKEHEDEPESQKKTIKSELIIESDEEQDENDIILMESTTMNSIYEALDKTQESDVDRSILQEFHIIEPGIVPQSHKIEKSLLSHPSKSQLLKFNQLPFTMKKGGYTTGEDQKIRDNWMEFCKLHDVDPTKPELFMPALCEPKHLLPPEERLKFGRCLGVGLENRMLNQIYQRFQLLFASYKKGKFTPDEDKLIVTYAKYAKSKKQFLELAAILNRHENCIRKRHRYLKRGAGIITWTMERMGNLVKNLLEITKSKNVDDLKNVSLVSDEWKELEDKMHIPVAKLRRKWNLYIYPRLFVDVVNLNEIQIKLIELLDDIEDSERRNIRWNDLALHFEGVPGTRLFKIYTDLLSLYVPAKERLNLQASLVHLKDAIPQLILRRKKVERWSYENGKLINIESG